MEKQNGKNGSSQLSEKSQDSQFKVRDRSLGTIPVLSSEHGLNQIPTSGEDSDQPNLPVIGQWSSNGIPGKIIGQLIDENERQLAYHEQQVELIKGRIKQLREIPESIPDLIHAK
ncbi:hypothetical protein [Nostoc sp.]|uniref:hypothetical protein n=1 Tax=Nostoc sp. TaxID=1180 RepID=UPI002FFC16B0